MARNPQDDSGTTSDLSWVGKETLETVSLFSINGATRIPRCLIGRGEDCEMIPPLLQIGFVRDSWRTVSLCMKQSSGKWVFDFPSLPFT